MTSTTTTATATSHSLTEPEYPPGTLVRISGRQYRVIKYPVTVDGVEGLVLLGSVDGKRRGGMAGEGELVAMSPDEIEALQVVPTSRRHPPQHQQHRHGHKHHHERHKPEHGHQEQQAGDSEEEGKASSTPTPDNGKASTSTPTTTAKPSWSLADLIFLAVFVSVMIGIVLLFR